MSDSKVDRKPELASLAKTDQIKQAVKLLKAGELVAFPTETVYGLGADASNPDAVKKIFEAKGRPADHPVIVHLHSAEEIRDWAKDISENTWLLADAFWPGPLTLILKKQTHVLDCVTGGQDSVGLRVPSHPVAQELLTAFGGGVVAPSANLFGHISPTSAEHVRTDFADAIPLILDGGNSEVGLESTIVDLTGPNPRVLRPGGISVSDLKAVISTIELVSKEANSKTALETNSDTGSKNLEQGALASTGELRASGLLDKHYAPKVKTYLIKDLSVAFESIKEALASGSRSEEKQIGVIAFSTSQSSVHTFETQVKTWIQLANTPEAYAKQLYSSMRNLEDNVDEIWIEAVPEDKAWLAVNDRLRRATVSFDV